MKTHRDADGHPDEQQRRRWRGWGRRRPVVSEPDLEPTHDQPWVPTSGLTDRIRRSPRE
ncbi:MAG: hypothetical protein ACXWA9_03170 [Acidimicrobiia bacterium]